MRTNFLIVHGTMGGPDGNWFPWLKQKLEQDGANVLIPLFPTPGNQSFASWRAVAESALQNLDPAHTVLIGHSIGAIFALRLAETAAAPYKATIPVCPFARDLGLTPYDDLNATFVHHRFDWPRIQNNAGIILCFAGANDPYVPLPYAREVADAAKASLTLVEQGGHLNGESGFLEFSLLLDKIRQTVNA